jgi:hypothetical protein
MERVSSMGLARKKRSERNVAFLYTGAMIILLVVWIVSYEVSKYVDIQEILSRFGVFSDTLSALFSAVKTMYVFMDGMLKGLFQAALAIKNAYYHTFIVFAGILLLTYSMVSKRIGQTDGGAR